MVQNKVALPMLSMGSGAVKAPASRIRKGIVKSLLTAVIGGGYDCRRATTGGGGCVDGG